MVVIHNELQINFNISRLNSEFCAFVSCCFDITDLLKAFLILSRICVSSLLVYQALD